MEILIYKVEIMHSYQQIPLLLKALMLSLLLATLSISTSTLAAESDSTAQAFSASGIDVPNPGTDLWRAVRQRDMDITGTTQMKAPDSGTLINVSGQAWREFRMEKLVPLGMLLIGSVLLILIIFRLLTGGMKLRNPRSGIKVPRFTPFQRLVHWSVAILFLTLGLTGIILTFGRSGIIPIIGKEAFSYLAIFAKTIHDFAGPVFSIALLIMLFTFMKGNFAKLMDIKWILKAGGMFGSHVSAGRYNAGEKGWYWLAMIVGAVVVVSGLILDFPIFGQDRATMELSHVVHSIAAIGLLAVSFGHIYMGTVGVEGAFEAMKTGYCDKTWAEEHHDIWLEEVEQEGNVGKTFEELEAQEKITRKSTKTRAHHQA